MTTCLYLVRHGATEADLAHPPRLSGRRQDPPLARLGIRQAEATRDFLAPRGLDFCYCSPLLRAVQTAALVAAPHGILTLPLTALTEADLGHWEGLDWAAIRYLYADAHARFRDDPATHGYPGGETFRAVHDRAAPALERLLTAHAGHATLVVTHATVLRVLLAALLGLTPGQAHQVPLDPCGISVVRRDAQHTSVTTLNAAFHLHHLAAA